MIRNTGRAGGLAAAALLLPGCLGDPPIEERWTRLEFSTPPSVTEVAPGQSTPITLTARLTYREILTGFVIADVRRSDTLTADDVDFERTDDPLAMTREVDRVIAASTSLGFATRAVTGFDHLIQEIPLELDAGFPPPTADGVAVDSTTVAGGTGLFLILYIGDVDEVELRNGDRIDVVTPRLSEAHELLTVGVELAQPAP